MKSITLQLIAKVILPVLLLVIGAYIVAGRPDFPIYYVAYYNWIILFVVLFILIACLALFWELKRSRLKEFRKSFPVYKPTEKLKPEDFAIFTYNAYYVSRESDDQVEKSLKVKGIAFIAGIPALGKTRGAYELAKKLKGYYLLKPIREKIDINDIKFPFFFKSKRIAILFDDLEKYAGRFNIDEMISALSQKAGELKIIVTCRTGREFDEISGKKDMEVLLSKCRNGKTEPRLLNESEQRNLAKESGQDWNKVTPDGTPGSIVLGIERMKKRYCDLRHEQKVILHVLKLLREGGIFTWKEELVKNIAAGHMFGLGNEQYKWAKWLKSLEINGFIKITDSLVNISHDTYLTGNFIEDYIVYNKDLINLINELYKLKDAENLFYMGKGFYYKKLYDQSIDSYRKSTKLDKNALASHNNLGVILKDLGRYEEAEGELREAISIKADYADAHNNLGILFTTLGRYKEAEEECREAIRLLPNDGDVHNNFAILLITLERYKEAEEECKAAIRLKPDSADVHFNLGSLLYKLERYIEAEVEYREAIRLEPDHAKVRGNLGILLIVTGKIPEAKSELEKARELFRQQGMKDDAKKAEDIISKLPTENW